MIIMIKVCLAVIVSSFPHGFDDVVCCTYVVVSSYQTVLLEETVCMLYEANNVNCLQLILAQIPLERQPLGNQRPVNVGVEEN